MSIAWISHRGESIDAPENTLSAFKLSSARDVDGMECDIISLPTKWLSARMTAIRNVLRREL